MAYTGKALNINLSTGKTEIKSVDQALLEDYIGGKGLGFALLEQYAPNSDPLGPENPLIFSSNPKISILTVLQKLMDLRTSASATSWGVVTITALASEIVWATVKGSSPVPGGESMIRKSRSFQSTSPINCLMRSDRWAPATFLIPTSFPRVVDLAVARFMKFMQAIKTTKIAIIEKT